LPLVYDELRKLAAARLSNEKPGQTLQATALVHEAYMRLAGNGAVDQRWNGKSHFFAAAAEAMRRILVEHARKKARRNDLHGPRISLENLALSSPFDAPLLLSLNDALSDLEELDESAAQLVKLRFFGGLTMVQAAEVMGVSLRTAERDWTYARSWLHRQLGEDDR
jgi:RNA polymerase sigma factor (TIGR02999 family)